MKSKVQTTPYVKVTRESLGTSYACARGLRSLPPGDITIYTDPERNLDLVLEVIDSDDHVSSDVFWFIRNTQVAGRPVYAAYSATLAEFSEMRLRHGYDTLSLNDPYVVAQLLAAWATRLVAS